jgi:hypothetical protein
MATTPTAPVQKDARGQGRPATGARRRPRRFPLWLRLYAGLRGMVNRLKKETDPQTRAAMTEVCNELLVGEWARQQSRRCRTAESRKELRAFAAEQFEVAKEKAGNIPPSADPPPAEVAATPVTAYVGPTYSEMHYG